MCDSSSDPRRAAIEASLSALAPPTVTVGVACATFDRRDRSAATIAIRDALKRLGRREITVPPVDRGARRWPTGIVGSVSHAEGLAVALVGQSDDHEALGVDIERCTAPDDDISALVLSASDHPPPATIDAARWLMLHFSAKESVYKAIAHRADGFVDFPDIALAIDVAAGRFTASAATPLLAGCGLERLAGRFDFASGLVVTLVHSSSIR